MAGRNKVLNDEKREVVVALLSGGMQLAQVADYVGCAAITIRREQAANAEFDERVRRAKLSCKIRPLEAMRRMAATHWRAAAWMIERDDRREAARQGKSAHIARRDLDTLQRALAEVVDKEVGDTMQAWRVREQISRTVALWASRPGDGRAANAMFAPTATVPLVLDQTATEQIEFDPIELAPIESDHATGEQPLESPSTNPTDTTPPPPPTPAEVKRTIARLSDRSSGYPDVPAMLAAKLREQLAKSA